MPGDGRSSFTEGERAIFDAMPELGWVAAPDGEIVHGNRCWCEYAGAAPEGAVHEAWQSALEPASLPSVLERWRVAIARGAPFEIELPLRRHDGAFRWFRARMSPQRDANGEIVRWIGAGTDIEAQRRIEEERLRAVARVERLTDLAFALSGARTPAEVADLVVEQGMRSAHADTCTLYTLDSSGPGGPTLVLLAQRGCAPEVVAKVRRISRTEGNPAALDKVMANESVWAETPAEYAAIFPAIARTATTAPRAKAFWSVPLFVEGAPVGLLGMGFFEGQRFSPDERAFVHTFAKQCAQALVRAQRREREETARRWLATTLQSIGDAVIATDADGRVTFMNAVAERLTGWPESDARGRPLAEVFAIFAEGTHAPAESPVSKVLREGRVVGLANHTVLRARSGVEIPIDDSGAPIRDEHGVIFGVVLVFRDASREKRAEKRREFLVNAAAALASSLDYHVTLARVASLAVPHLADWCTVDILEPGNAAPQQVAVAHADPAMLEYAREVGQHYPPDPNAPTGAPNVIRTGKSELYSEIPAALLEAGARDAEHLRIIRALHLESAMVVPLPARDGRVLGAMTFIYASGRRYLADDLAFAESFARHAAMAIENARALREAEGARAREQVMRREAELASSVKDEFLATVSHELRTPLNAILGWTVTLRQRVTEGEVARGLEVIERNARTQTRLVEDILDVSRIMSGKLALAVVPVDLGEALGHAVDAMRPAATAKGVALDALVDEDAGALRVLADPVRLQQVLWNLLTNAVKFTPRGGAVMIHAERVGSEVLVEVTDTGEGIPAAALATVFEPFRQADNSTTRRHGGLGLGLSLVHQLVTAHGGTVQARSAGPGKGASFSVHLPARAITPAVTRPSQPTPIDESTAAGGAGVPVLPRLDGITVLVVDDEMDARDLVREIFMDLGAEVHLASSASEAMAQVKDHRPDVIVSDIGMPHVDGYTMIRNIRSLPPEQGGRTPAIALTAYSRREDAERAFAAGYQRHVPKPVDTAELASVVLTLGGRALTGS